MGRLRGKHKKSGRVLSGARPKYSSRGTEASSYPDKPYQLLTGGMNFAKSQNISSLHRPRRHSAVSGADDCGNPRLGLGQLGLAVFAQSGAAFVGGDRILQLLLAPFQGADDLFQFGQ